MISRLTDETQLKIREYRDRYFRQATCTDPADRSRAESAARRIAEISGVKISNIQWIDSPYAWESLRESLGESLRASLSDSLMDSLRASLSDSLWASLSDSLWASLRASLSDSLMDSLRASLSDSLWASLWDSLGDSLRDSLWASLWASLSDSLSNSLRDSLRASLRDSLGASLWDSGWLALYTYAVEQLGVEILDKNSENLKILKLHNELAASCFALWIVPDTAILCERPESVELDNGRLVGVTWRGRKEICHG